MSPRRLLLVLICLAGGLLAAGGPAFGESPVLVDCDHNQRLTGHYTIAQLSSALAHMPADIQEYSVCPAVIQRQILIQEGRLKVKKGSSSRASGGSSGTLVIVIVLIVILLAGGGLAYAARRRASGGGGPQAPTSG